MSSEEARERAHELKSDLEFALTVEMEANGSQSPTWVILSNSLYMCRLAELLCYDLRIVDITGRERLIYSCQGVPPSQTLPVANVIDRRIGRTWRRSYMARFVSEFDH